MLKSIASRLGMLAGALALQAVFSASAFAHGFSLTAEAVCEEGVRVIYFTATSRSPLPGEGENPSILVFVNGIQVADEPFVYPGNSFSGSAPAPADDTAVVTAVAAGSWGDGAAGGQEAGLIVTLPAECTTFTGEGRFTGGGHQIRVGAARVTRGLTIHCDLLLSNNLEVNWNGNQFHTTEHLETVACTDDPAIIQAPPPAPLDTLVGVGTGRYNGVDGYTIEFTLVDYGEPGTSDQAALYIYETANPANVVLNVPLQLLTGGNLQAHYDQPHR